MQMGDVSDWSLSYDNAAMESWNSTFKFECGEVFDAHAAAKELVFDYIEVLYNPQRRHSAIGYLSPAEFERAARIRAVAWRGGGADARSSYSWPSSLRHLPDYGGRHLPDFSSPTSAADALDGRHSPNSSRFVELGASEVRYRGLEHPYVRAGDGGYGSTAERVAVREQEVANLSTEPDQAQSRPSPAAAPCRGGSRVRGLAGPNQRLGFREREALGDPHDCIDA